MIKVNVYVYLSSYIFSGILIFDKFAGFYLNHLLKAAVLAHWGCKLATFSLTSFVASPLLSPGVYRSTSVPREAELNSLKRDHTRLIS